MSQHFVQFLKFAGGFLAILTLALFAIKLTGTA